MPDGRGGGGDGDSDGWLVVGSMVVVVGFGVRWLVVLGWLVVVA